MAKIRAKWGTKDIDATVTDTVVSINGIKGITRTVTRVICEMADKLMLQVWKNQEKIFEGNTAQLITAYGSATVFRSEAELNEELVEGDTLSLMYFNNTGGALTDLNGIICYQE